MLAHIRLRLLPAVLIAALVIGSLVPAAASATAPAAAIGEVTFVIGTARRTDAGGASSAVTRGMQVGVADRIETEAGGHVHVRFVDGAFVSVRPGSRLRIDDYRVDRGEPQGNAVRFTLEEGVVRSITGDAARVAKDRFRLNTPIAAIGVRGTDFVVLSEAEAVRLTVNSGAVVMAPLGNGCAAEALGACSTPLARILSADMGRTMLEYARLAEAPRLVPVTREHPGPNQISPGLPQEPGPGIRGVQMEYRASVLVAEAPAALPPPAPPAREPAPAPAAPVAAEQTPTPTPTPAPVPTPATPAPELPVVAEPMPAPAPLPVPVPVAVEPPVPAPPPQLVWGRYAAEPLPGDKMTVTYATAKPGREATVGDNSYLLLRTQSDQIRISPNLGRVEFSLREATASFRDSAGTVSAAAVNNGWLRVDFDQLSFATGLQLSSDKAGSHSLSASGYVRDDGIFTARSDTARVAGATSLDGREAGYLFERYLPIGTFSGLTLWKR